jgi:hypothetical protein
MELADTPSKSAKARVFSKFRVINQVANKSDTYPPSLAENNPRLRRPHTKTHKLIPTSNPQDKNSATCAIVVRRAGQKRIHSTRVTAGKYCGDRQVVEIMRHE